MQPVNRIFSLPAGGRNILGTISQAVEFCWEVSRLGSMMGWVLRAGPIPDLLQQVETIFIAASGITHRVVANIGRLYLQYSNDRNFRSANQTIMVRPKNN